MKTNILIILILIIAQTTFAQKKKLPKGVEISSDEFKKCTVCRVNEVINGKTLVYFYDVIEKKEVTPKEANLVTYSYISERTHNGYALYAHEGKTSVVKFELERLKTKGFTIKNTISSYSEPVSIDVEITGNTHTDSHGISVYKDHDFLCLESKNFDKDLYVVFDRKERNFIGSKFYFAYPHKYNFEVSEHDKEFNSIIFKKLENGYFQILLPDLTLYPNIDKYKESLGLQIFTTKAYQMTRLSNVVLEVLKIENKTQYRPLSIFTWDNMNRYPVVKMNLIDNSLYTYYEWIREYKNNSVHKTSIYKSLALFETFLLKKDESYYTMIGPADAQTHNGIRINEDDTPFAWAVSTNKEGVLSETAEKWDAILQANKEHAHKSALEGIKRMEENDERERLAKQQKDQTYSQACKDWKACVDSRKGWTYCNKNVKNIHLLSYDDKKRLNADVELVVEREKKAEQYSKSQTYEGGSSYIDQQMKRDGYKKMKWNSKSGKWVYD